MKIDLPATLTAEIDYVYPEKMNWSDPEMHPEIFVVVKFGNIEVARAKPTEKQLKYIDPYSHNRTEEEQEIATEVAAEMLRKVLS